MYVCISMYQYLSIHINMYVCMYVYRFICMYTSERDVYDIFRTRLEKIERIGQYI